MKLGGKCLTLCDVGCYFPHSNFHCQTQGHYHKHRVYFCQYSSSFCQHDYKNGAAARGKRYVIVTNFLIYDMLSRLEQICVKCNFRTLKLPFDVWQPVHIQMTVIRHNKH